MKGTAKRWVKRVLRPLLGAGQALVGSRSARSDQESYVKSLGSLVAQVAEVKSRDCSSDSDDSPIFVLSAGWRSGSTLIQRLLMSNGTTLIWGEPYDRSCIIQRLTETLYPFSSDWPPERSFLKPSEYGALSRMWVANLYPPVASLKSGYLALMDNLFAKPAREVGASRWGVKEVRLGVNDAQFLRWLYPKAKFLFVYRNPYDAYRSYRSVSNARDWYSRWPVAPAFTPAAFGTHWQRLALDFQENADSVDGLIVKYEDLISGKLDVTVLSDFCEIDIDKSILEVRVGGEARVGGEVRVIGSPRRSSGLPLLERLLLSRATAPLATRLGYHL